MEEYEPSSERRLRFQHNNTFLCSFREDKWGDVNGYINREGRVRFGTEKTKGSDCEGRCEFER